MWSHTFDAVLLATRRSIRVSFPMPTWLNIVGVPKVFYENGKVILEWVR